MLRIFYHNLKKRTLWIKPLWVWLGIPATIYIDPRKNILHSIYELKISNLNVNQLSVEYLHDC